MIGYLLGKPVVQKNSLLILVQGIGYQVHVHRNMLNELSSQNVPELELFIYTHVREDALLLFGFKQIHEKELFKLVLSVPGVGPAIALEMVGSGADALIEAVQNANTSFFTAIPRVGKKLAQKTIIELSSKLGEIKALELESESSLYTEVVESLTSLGLNEQFIRQQLSQFDLEQIGVAEVVKIILKNAKKK